MPELMKKITSAIKGRLHRRMRKYRKFLIHCLRASPISSRFIGPPKGLYVTAIGWISRAGSSAALTEIYPGRSGERIAPKTLDQCIPWEFDTFFDGMRSNESPAFILSMPYGRVVGEGAVISPDDHLIGDVSRELIPRNDQRRHSVFSRLKLPPVSKIDGSVAVLAVQAAEVYWHWMFDLMPRIHLLSKGGAGLAGIDHFVVNKLRVPFQGQMLARVGIPESKIITCTRETHFEARTLLIPSIIMTVPAKWSCDYVRGLYLPAERPLSSNRRSRIYVSRSDARMRRVTNETELTRYLGAHGFETVTLTGLTIADQASMFADADVIVAPHGSGLTNLLFCRPGTRIIELFSATYVNPCYWALSNTVGLDYYCYLGTGERPPAPPEGMDKKSWFFEHLGLDKKHGTDILVDIDSLSILLNRALSDIA